MKLTVLGGAGAWPPADGACSGYLIEHAGFRLLVDPGYAPCRGYWSSYRSRPSTPCSSATGTPTTSPT